MQPENVVFVDPVHSLKRNTRLTIKLVDFGLARPYSSARSVKARLGSPGFMAPEVRASAEVMCMPSDAKYILSSLCSTHSTHTPQMSSRRPASGRRQLHVALWTSVLASCWQSSSRCVL